MKRFTVPADFSGIPHPFTVYIGQPAAGYHPLHFQMRWLKEMRGGVFSQEVSASFSKLLAIAKENNVSFEDLCVSALSSDVNTAPKE